MKYLRFIIVPLFFTVVAGCITKFLPETDENQNLVVVEGLITDQNEVYTIKLSTSMPLGKKLTLKPLKGCKVTITDDLNVTYFLTEKAASGTYLTDSSKFRGVIGRKYTLHVNTVNATSNHYSYQSQPMEMKAVPVIDSLFYEKVLIKEDPLYPGFKTEGCQIYINTHDPDGKCKFFRWDYNETWEFRIPYDVPNKICWISNKSNVLRIKNTSVLAEDRIIRYPLLFISNETDRLSEKYSILVNQYSLNEDEYLYWEKMKSFTEDVGTLYDIIPASILGNIFCIEDPEETVLGYFSVSAKKSKRIFINSWFSGLVDQYTNCATDTASCHGPIPNLNISVWIIEEICFDAPFIRVLTSIKSCADCTVRGTKIKPDFWTDDK